MSTRFESSPSLDAGRPATCGNGQQASASTQADGAAFLMDGRSRFRNLQAALTLARFVCFVVDGTGHRFVEPLGGRPDMSVVSWSETRDLLSYHVGRVNDWADEAADEDDLSAVWPDVIWRVTFPLQAFLDGHAFLDQVGTDTLLYTFLHFEDQARRLHEMSAGEWTGEPRQ